MTQRKHAQREKTERERKRERGGGGRTDVADKERVIHAEVHAQSTTKER